VHLAAPQPLLEHDAAVRGDAMGLEDVLGQIQVRGGWARGLGFLGFFR
jgi:hypothetical protein